MSHWATLKTATNNIRVYMLNAPDIERMAPRPRVETAMIRATVPNMDILSLIRFISILVSESLNINKANGSNSRV